MGSQMLLSLLNQLEIIGQHALVKTRRKRTEQAEITVTEYPREM